MKKERTFSYNMPTIMNAVIEYIFEVQLSIHPKHKIVHYNKVGVGVGRENPVANLYKTTTENYHQKLPIGMQTFR